MKPDNKSFNLFFIYNLLYYRIISDILPQHVDIQFF